MTRPEAPAWDLIPHEALISALAAGRKTVAEAGGDVNRSQLTILSVALTRLQLHTPPIPVMQDFTAKRLEKHITRLLDHYPTLTQRLWICRPRGHDVMPHQPQLPSVVEVALPASAAGVQPPSPAAVATVLPEAAVAEFKGWLGGLFHELIEAEAATRGALRDVETALLMLADQLVSQRPVVEPAAPTPAGEQAEGAGGPTGGPPVNPPPGEATETPAEEPASEPEPGPVPSPAPEPEQEPVVGEREAPLFVPVAKDAEEDEFVGDFSVADDPMLVEWRGVAKMVFKDGLLGPKKITVGVFGGRPHRYHKKLDTLKEHLGVDEFFSIPTDRKNSRNSSTSSGVAQIHGRNMQLLIIVSGWVLTPMSDKAAAAARERNIPFARVYRLGDTIGIAKQWLANYGLQRKRLAERKAAARGGVSPRML